ncbi:hypothetical protein NLX94_12250 [Streptomyces sp. TBY4]|nr:hypothetical protein [Streptomyces sp. TBY4]
MNPLERENYLIIQVMQACLGLISDSVRGISVQVDTERITLYFSVSNRSPELEEDIDDIQFELDAFTEGRFYIDAEVHDGPPDEEWPGHPWRKIYMESHRRYES